MDWNILKSVAVLCFESRGTCSRKRIYATTAYKLATEVKGFLRLSLFEGDLKILRRQMAEES